jgi:threonine 3-dehydrogenase
MLGDYFSNKYNLDFRSLRYPGVISSEKYAFNGTTDYSTEIFFHLLEKGEYKCFLKEDAELPMIYIDDCIDATVRFLKADPNKLLRSVYNLAGISFTPKQLADAIAKIIPNTKVTYEPDYR